MKRPMFEGRYFATYYYASLVRNLLCDRFSYLRKLDQFFCDDHHLQLIPPFSRKSAFHSFIEFVVDDVIWDEIDDIDIRGRQEEHRLMLRYPGIGNTAQPTVFPINHELACYGIPHTSFTDWLTEQRKNFQEATLDDVSDYHSEMRVEQPYGMLLERATNEVFFVLFQNRHLLLLFNGMMADRVQKTVIETLKPDTCAHFVKGGVLKRVHIPQWVKRAVFFRDRGLCVICQRDLSGLVNISNVEHYDHMVPLAQGGLNDVTNIQLLCQDCNLRKRDDDGCTSNFFQAWYAMTDTME